MRKIVSGPAQGTASLQKQNTICYIRYIVTGIYFSEIESIQHLSVYDKIVSHIVFSPTKESGMIYADVFLNEGHTPDKIHECTKILFGIFAKIASICPCFFPDQIDVKWSQKGYKEETQVRALSNSVTCNVVTPIAVSEEERVFIGETQEEDRELFYSCVYSIIALENVFIKFLYLYQILHLLIGGSQSNVSNKIREMEKVLKLQIKLNQKWYEVGNPKKRKDGDYLTYLRNGCAHCVDMFGPLADRNPISNNSLLKFAEFEKDVRTNLKKLLRIVFFAFKAANAEQVKIVADLVRSK